MPVAIEYLDENLRAALSGEIDHHSAKELRAQIDDAITRAVPQKLVMDFSAVTFMDSSGIGLVMGRYKQVAVYGGTLSITGLGVQQRKVMRLAGLDKLCSFEETGEKTE
ncbi:MAG: anti-sigma factor antagonist [Provencibacterium sp.]|jgi:stage II sporulation protein AA (anti-sigma F factor antagonist)|nr:anti-sigma factor antagonist [Provencibacterium sp.]